MSHSFTTAIELWKEYTFWQHSQQILRRSITQVLPDQPDAVQAALENSLMLVMLKQSAAPADLFRSFDEEVVEYGFECVATSLPENGAKAILHIVQEELQHFSNAPLDRPIPEVQISEDLFSIGTFSVPRIAPVERAYQTLLRTYAPEQAQIILLRARLRYSSIYAETRHIGPPQIVYDHFYDWGVRNEGFASPFNARVLGKDQAQFYSLFPETDAPFGSGGSFFHLEAPKNPGHWCLDPPFLTETMDRVDKVITRWRQERPETSLLLVIPESHQPANTPDETVTLSAGTHFYEGLEGSLHPLPVNVCVHRYGELPGFSADSIQQGYLPAS